PGVDDSFALLQPQRPEHAVHAVRAEDPHEVVFERQIELRPAGVTLTARAPAELIIDTAALVPLRADDVEASRLDDGLGRLIPFRRLDLDDLLGLEGDLAIPGDLLVYLRDTLRLLGLVEVGRLLLDAHLRV